MAIPTIKTGSVKPMPMVERQRAVRADLGIYRLLTRVARPLAPLILRYRQRRGKEDAERLGERLGQASLPRPNGPICWVHAASVGEASAVLPLVARLVQQRPDVSVLLTTGTVTSARFAESRLPERTRHQYIPLDAPQLVCAFLDHWQPSLGVFTEQDVWPNLVIEAAQRRIPLALVNARMSDASFERWQRRIGLAEALYSRFSVVLAQNELLAQRFQRLGARRALAVGNLKIDAPAPPIRGEAFAALSQALAGRPRVVAASTHKGEEVAIALAHRQMMATLPQLVTIIAPRHPERGGAIAAAIEGLGLKVVLRSSGALPSADTDIYIADTIGELGTLYASAPVAFIGGSLVPHGGQNPIEAVRHGAVVVMGHFTHNFADACAALVATDGAVIVDGPEGLAPALGGLLGDEHQLAIMKDNATRALESLSGALDRSLAILLPLLPEIAADEGWKRAG